MKKNNSAITFILLIISGSLFAQNPVTFIPPDPAKGGPAAAPVKTDTIITVIDAAKNYRRVVVLQNDIMVQDGCWIGKNKTGKWYNYSPTGLLINLAEYDNGVKSGIYMEFDKGGALVVQETYKNDKLDGEQKKYAFGPGGRILKSSYSYSNGNYNGTSTEYGDNGLIRSQIQYKDGKKHGTTKWYYTNGKIAMMQTYSNDMLNGPQKVYNQTGGVTSEGDYAQNMKSGIWSEFYDNGKLKSQGAYKADVKTGIWKYYDENGTVIKTETF